MRNDSAAAGVASLVGARDDARLLLAPSPPLGPLTPYAAGVVIRSGCTLPDKPDYKCREEREREDLFNPEKRRARVSGASSLFLVETCFNVLLGWQTVLLLASFSRVSIQIVHSRGKGRGWGWGVVRSALSLSRRRGKQKGLRKKKKITTRRRRARRRRRTPRRRRRRPRCRCRSCAGPWAAAARAPRPGPLPLPPPPPPLPPRRPPRPRCRLPRAPLLRALVSPPRVVDRVVAEQEAHVRVHRPRGRGAPHRVRLVVARARIVRPRADAGRVGRRRRRRRRGGGRRLVPLHRLAPPTGDSLPPPFLPPPPPPSAARASARARLAAAAAAEPSRTPPRAPPRTATAARHATRWAAPPPCPPGCRPSPHLDSWPLVETGAPGLRATPSPPTALHHRRSLASADA